VKLDKDFEVVADEVAIPRKLADRLAKLHSKLQRVIVRVFRGGSKSPKKVNAFGIARKVGEAPTDEVEEIAEMIMHMAYSEAAAKEDAADGYEAMCEVDSIKKGGKEPKYIRFKIDEWGEGATFEKDQSEVDTILRAALDFVGKMGEQNSELHEQLLALSKVVQETATPMKDAMREMGNVVAQAYAQLTYALWMQAESSSTTKEAELEAQKWKDGMDILKEFAPPAVQQWMRKKGFLADEDEDDEDDDDETEEEDDETARVIEAEGNGKDPNAEVVEGKDGKKKGKKKGKKDKKKKKGGKKKHKVRTTAEDKLAAACEAFANLISEKQLERVKAKLTADEFAVFEQILDVDPDDNDEAKELVQQLHIMLRDSGKTQKLSGVFRAPQQKLLAKIVATALV